MTLRRRMTVLAAASVATAVCLAAVVAYVAVRGELRSQVDDSLRAAGEMIAERTPPEPPEVVGANLDRIPFRTLIEGDGDGGPLGTVAPSLQLLNPDGTTVVPQRFGARIPVDAGADEIAAAGSGAGLADAEVNGQHSRVLTVGLEAGGALQIARSLEPTDEVLTDLRTILFIVVAAGVGLAALLARRLSDRALTPITELTEAAEHIGETGDLSRRIDASAPDEVGRLAGRFNSMLAGLARSRDELASSAASQRRLVADASHELRTPVASLRTDIEVLRDNPSIREAERRRILDSLEERVADLGSLIGDVIELARGDEVGGEVADVRLDLLAAEAVDRIGRHAPSRRFELDLRESVVCGDPERLARAINNLLDNAVKYAPAARPIEVTVRGSELAVRDHGPGIPPDELELVFERFHRGRGVRETHGSGLGLAIVRQVAESHGGTALAENAPGGGATFRLRLPRVPVAGAG